MGGWGARLEGRIIFSVASSRHQKNGSACVGGGNGRNCRENGSPALSVDFGAVQFGCVCLPLVHKPSGVGSMVRTTLQITCTGHREVGRAVQDHTRGGQREPNSVPQMFVGHFLWRKCCPGVGDTPGNRWSDGCSSEPSPCRRGDKMQMNTGWMSGAKRCM